MSQAKVVPQEPTRSEVSPSEAPSENSNTESLSSDMAGIEYPGKHDVKLGRGGDANSHIGNIKFRQLISQYKPRYIAASRSNKPLVAEEVVQIWRNLDPPGRFLIRSDPSLGDDSTWHDVGNRRARKKASQALREKDRSEDLVASLAHHGHHVGIPGMAGVPQALAPGVSQVPGAHAATNNMVAAAAAAMAAAANDPSRKRTRQPDITSMFGGDRRVAPRTDVPPAIDPALAVRALQQILQSQGGGVPGVPVPQATEAASASPAVAQAPPATAPAPQPPAPQGQAPNAGGLDALLLPALQLLLQQKQQQQQQQQQQQNLSQLAAAIQSLVAPSQGQQQPQAQPQPQATTGNNEGSTNPPAPANLASALSALLAGANPGANPTATAPTAAASQGPAAQPVGTTNNGAALSSLFAQAGQFAAAPPQAAAAGNQPAPAAGAPNLYAAGQPGTGQPLNLDRLLATRILENLMNPNATSQRNGL